VRLARAQIEDRISPTGSDACREPRESDGGTTRWTVTQDWDSRRESESERQKEREKEGDRESRDRTVPRERNRPGDVSSYHPRTGSHMPIHALKTVNSKSLMYVHMYTLFVPRYYLELRGMNFKCF